MAKKESVSVQLGRDAILGAKDLETEEVHVPEWGGYVYVRGLSGVERDQLEQSTIQGKGKNRDVNLTGLRAKLAVRTVCDAEGNRIFADKDANALGAKSAGALERIVNVAQRLSGMSAEDVEELVSDFEQDQSEDSTSD